MENLETIRLSKQQELARYRQRPDAKSYIVNKLKEPVSYTHLTLPTIA